MSLRLSSAQKFLQIRNQRPQINLKHIPFTSNSSAAREIGKSMHCHRALSSPESLEAPASREVGDFFILFILF